MTQQQELLIALAILLVLSAIGPTATFAMYVGGFLLFVVWISSYSSGNLQPFLNELFSSVKP